MARPRKLIKRSPKKPSFFKILLGDFSKRLCIPPKFIQNFNGRSLRKCALKGPSGKWWTVELKERKNDLFFHNGWQGFVKDHHLKEGDFLVFRYDGESKFKVTIYDRTACEKDVEVAERRSGSSVSSVNKGQALVKEEIIDLESESNDENCDNKETVFGRRNGNDLSSRKRHANDYVEETSAEPILFKSKNSCFLASSEKRHLLYRVTIPKKLSIAEGLMTKDAVTLKDPAGRLWDVTLEVVKMSYCSRLDMTIGWTECRKVNQISVGDTIIYHF